MATRCLTVTGNALDSVNPRCVNVAVSVACASPRPAAGRVTSPCAVITAGSLVLHVTPGSDGSARFLVVALVSPRSTEATSSARLPAAAASDSAWTSPAVSTPE